LASIQVIQGPDKGKSYELADEGENIIGRQSRTVQLNDGTVSRQHARISGNNGAWMLEDFGSANGTYINGVRVKKPVSLKRGDQIRCGSSLLVFGGAGAALAAVDVDEEGRLVDAAIVATIPSSEDSVIIPTAEAGAQAIGSLRILYGLIGEISSIFNIDALLQTALDRVFSTLKPDRGWVILFDDGKMNLMASRMTEKSRDKRIPISRTIINEVVSKQVGVLSSNAMHDKRFASGQSVQDFGIHSAICAPIRGHVRILGVIQIDSSVSERTYNTEQLRLLTAIGFQTGMAIENVRLYEAAVQKEKLAAVGETVAFLSHHIKNILQALSAGIDVVEMGLKKQDLAKARDAWPIVLRNLGRINDLILNMLTFSKSREPLLENVNVNHVLSELVELVSPAADERGVAVMADLDEMPAIPADPAGLHQAFMNLLTNAMDAVEDGTGAITVSSRYDSMNRAVIVKVSDNGSGIPHEKLGRIFTPFYSSKGQHGTGLGLAVAKKVIEEHRGTIQAQSATGQGTTFTITLPAITAQPSGDTHGPAK